jgi:hypothetical protein
LQKEPNASGKKGTGPGEDEEQNEPKDCKAGIASHFCLCVCCRGKTDWGGKEMPSSSDLTCEENYGNRCFYFSRFEK